MSLLTLSHAELAFGDLPLLDDADMVVEAREHIGLIGRNGTGKSSLLAIIAGAASLDDGELRIADGTRVVMVEQEPALPDADSLRDSLRMRMATDAIADERDRWRAVAALEAHADRLGVRLDAPLQGLSGGERKRGALAAALAMEPDLLLLDEPTNHLDIEAIEQLEALIARGPTAIVITHDRRFLDRVATRIVELDRGSLRSYPGSFSEYERRKSEQLAEEQEHRRKFDKFWRQEEAWIRQGVQARRTRNEGRVRRLEALRTARDERRERQGQVALAIDAGTRSGRLVAELEGVSKSYPLPEGGTRTVVRDFSTTIRRGDRVGFIGPNGAGKTTLLRLITGAEQPDTGEVRLGTKLELAYFDQMRAQLDPERTVAETISPGSDWIEVGGMRKHVMSYLGDFLFSPRRAGSVVRSLSGGERNRLLLARLFAQPANVLVLDEPTNDLDIETLDLLESALQEYSGTLLLVSHDRAFLDAVVTQTIAFEGDGRWREYVGGYTDWLAQRPAPAATPAAPTASPGVSAAGRAAGTGTPAVRPARLGYKEQRELQSIPVEIEKLEAEQSALHERMAKPGYFEQDAATLQADAARIATIEGLLLELLERWEALERRAESAKSSSGG